MQPCDGDLGSGITCLVGPSGAGKSSLLGVLAGRKSGGVVGGSVTLGGRAASSAERRAHVGYVTQEDVLSGYRHSFAATHQRPIRYLLDTN